MGEGKYLERAQSARGVDNNPIVAVCGEWIFLVGLTFDDISPAYIPTSTVSWMAAFLISIDVPATFFVVPETIIDCSSEQAFSSCLRAILDLGHEASLHGYKHVKNEFGCFYPVPLNAIPIPSFDEQRERTRLGLEALTRLSGIRPLGFRSPFYLHNKLTLKALSSLGFKYDSSVTIFKPTHSMRFRLRWSRNYGPYLTEGLTEIPVTGDYAYNLNTSNFLFLLKKVLRDFEVVKSRNGAFVMNFHAHRLDKSILSEFIKAIVKRLRGKADFVRLVDMCLKS